MEQITIDAEKERKDILNAYRGLLRSFNTSRSAEDSALIRKAFNMAVEAHKNMRRKSGEPYIFHPIAVARICAEEMRLGTTSVIAALLHDTVEDTDVTLEDIEAMFGKKVARIIDGLTKISGVVDQNVSIQAENFRKVLLTLSDDVRVILIKLADRLHNMRTLGSMSKEKQLKIASETEYMYSPLAHRLGLNAIKTELEDLALKYRMPEEYESIESRLKKTQAVRNRFINSFCSPIKRQLDKEGVSYTLKARTKSVYSIWKKIHKKNIPFDEIYDLFAIRIIIDSHPEKEKSDCWKVYSIVTDFYQPNPDRLRDWVSTPKANGYESLHTTVMSPTGKWVEVQIRTQRMDEIAELGYAAHWRYKDSDKGVESGLDQWLNKIRELLENPESNALDFIDDFKLNLFSEEIFVFTPKGDLFNLPQGSTTLDFAFEIHSQIGQKCIGAKVNNKLVPLSHVLKSGDQVEIITSNKQSPKEDWLKFVVTARAKSRIKSALKEEKREIANEGKRILEKKLKEFQLTYHDKNLAKIEEHFKAVSSLDLFYRIAKGSVDLNTLKDHEIRNGEIYFRQPEEQKPAQTLEQIVSNVRGTASDTLVIGDGLQNLDYKLSQCCKPIPGDDVFGFITINEGIKIHRVSCPNAVQLMSNYGYRVVKARWKGQEMIEFMAGVRFRGYDEVGLVNKITNVISQQLNINMRSISFETNDGIFEGKIFLYVHDTNHLDKLMKALKEISGVQTVDRIDTE